MNQTNFGLIFIDQPDPKYIYLQDTTEYNPDIEVSTPLFEITPPNFSTKYVVSYPVSSIIPINSNALGWTDTSDYNSLVTLVDGLWTFKQSVSPNDCNYYIHYHFRTVNLKQKIMDYVSEQLDYSNPSCNLSDDWFKSMFDFLQLLDAAKYLSENCNKFEQSKIIYNQVSNGFKKFGCSDC